MNSLMAGASSAHVGNQSLVMKGCMGRGLAEWALSSGWAGLVGWAGGAKH